MNYDKASATRRTKTNAEALSKVKHDIDILSNEILTPVIAGEKSIVHACRDVADADLSYRWITTMLDVFVKHKEHMYRSEKVNDELYLTGPESFYADVFGYTFLANEEMLAIPLDIDAVVKWIIDSAEGFSSRERDLMHYIYIDELDLGQTGEKLGVSKERARQMKLRCMRKMRSTHRKRERLMLKYGITAGEELDIQLEKEKQAQINRLIFSEANGDDWVTTRHTTFQDFAMNHKPIPEISVRAYNAVKHGFGSDVKVGFLADMTLEQLATVRNLGRRTAEELYKSLAPYRSKDPADKCIDILFDRIEDCRWLAEQLQYKLDLDGQFSYLDLWHMVSDDQGLSPMEDDEQHVGWARDTLPQKPFPYFHRKNAKGYIMILPPPVPIH